MTLLNSETKLKGSSEMGLRDRIGWLEFLEPLLLANQV